MLIIFIVIFAAYSVFADVLVELPDGKIKGRVLQTPNKFSFFAFNGIPYARPPIGKYRFQPPVPPTKWNGVLDVTKDAPACVSNFFNETTSDESEDCLIVNVYTPNLSNGTEKLPVMFWIHGGAFIHGGSKYIWFGPDFLIEKDVILVTINYRLGPFGFLSTGDSVLPGNMGMKDQQLALKWTHQNIAMFGGDPDKITIFGQSAGAGSTGMHLLSKRSAGLFRGAICQSGSALSLWAIGQKPKPSACDLMRALTSNSSASGADCSSTEVLKTVKEFSTQEIIDAANRIGSGVFKLLFLPVLEPESDHSFLSFKEYNYDLLMAGKFHKVPLMIGITSQEYLGLIADLNEFVNERTKTYDDNNLLLISADMNIYSDTKRIAAAKEIKSIYVKDDSVTFKEDPGALVRFFSDDQFMRSVRKHAELQQKFTDVYFYQYSYNGTIRYRNNIVKGAKGIGHSEELPFIFSQRTEGYDNTDFSNYTKSDKQNHDRLVKLWTDFAKNLNPTPEKSAILQNVIWPKLEENCFRYLDIGDDITIKTNIKETVYQKWLAVFEKYAEPPIITY